MLLQGGSRAQLKTARPLEAHCQALRQTMCMHAQTNKLAAEHSTYSATMQLQPCLQPPEPAVIHQSSQLLSGKGTAGHCRHCQLRGQLRSPVGRMSPSMRASVSLRLSGTAMTVESASGTRANSACASDHSHLLALACWEHGWTLGQHSRSHDWLKVAGNVGGSLKQKAQRWFDGLQGACQSASPPTCRALLQINSVADRHV